LSNLLDTSVLSQRIKPVPHGPAAAWLRRVEHSEQFVSVVTLWEIRYGIEMTPPGRKRQLYEDWLTKDIRGNYAQNFLPVDDRIAELAGKLIAQGKLAGAEPEPADALIAATARVHGLKVATLNRKHFVPLGVELVDF